MSEPEIYDLIIVGGGPAGFSAGLYSMRACLKTVLFEKGVPGGQLAMSDLVENYPGFLKIKAPTLSNLFAHHAKSFGLETRTQEVVAVEPGLKYHQVRLDDDSVVQAHAIVLAMGGNPRQLGIPGETENYGRGVSYCAVCDGFFFRNRTVVVVGGGDSAVEEGLYLAKLAKKVYLIHRRDELRASRILQERILGDCNVEVVWNSVVTEVKSDDMGVNIVALKDTQTGGTTSLETEGVFIYIGFEPNRDLVPAGIQLNPDGYVRTDEKCETDIPGIFAVGDLREKYAKQIVLAAADGCTSALAAAHYVEAKKSAEEDTCTL